MQCNAIQVNAAECNAMQCNVRQCKAMLCKAWQVLFLSICGIADRASNSCDGWQLQVGMGTVACHNMTTHVMYDVAMRVCIPAVRRLQLSCA